MTLTNKVFLFLVVFLVGCSAFPEYDIEEEPKTIVVEAEEAVPEPEEKEELVGVEVIEEIPFKAVLEEEEEETECVIDDDCEGKEILSASCFQGNVNQQYRLHVCKQGQCVTKGGQEIVECDSTDEICTKGECLLIEDQPCTDTDGGIEEDIEGKVFDGTRAWHKDKCLDSGHLEEFYCSNGNTGRALSKTFSCNCNNGQCV